MGYSFHFLLWLSAATGSNMLLLKNIKRELLPTANKSKPGRWRGKTALPQINVEPEPKYQESSRGRQSEGNPSRSEARQSIHSREEAHRSVHSREGRSNHSREETQRPSHSRGSEHLNVRPPSAYSATITLAKVPDSWVTSKKRLDMVKVRFRHVLIRQHAM